MHFPSLGRLRQEDYSLGTAWIKRVRQAQFAQWLLYSGRVRSSGPTDAHGAHGSLLEAVTLSGGLLPA